MKYGLTINNFRTFCALVLGVHFGPNIHSKTAHEINLPQPDHTLIISCVAIEATRCYPPLGVAVVWEFQEFQELQFSQNHSVSKDENASRKSKDEKCPVHGSIVIHSFCSELNLLMLNRSYSSNFQLFLSIN